MSERPALVLVHGAWHGSWSWQPLTDILGERGWSVTAVELPTVNSERKAELGMQDDADAVAEAIAAVDGRVVVVAHSYGGIPTTQAATDPRVCHIVYVAAFALDEGESLLGAVGGKAPDWWHIDGSLVTAGDDVQTPQQIFYGDVDAATADAATAKLLPQSLNSFTDAVTAVAWRDRPTTYVVTERDAAIPVGAQEMLAARSGSDVARMDTGHSPFLSQPQALADIIEQAADRSA